MSGPAAGVRPLEGSDPGVLGPYVLLGRLGDGGQGVVYLSRGSDQRHVAVKKIHVVDARMRGLFAREAEHARKVARHCTAQVLDYDFDADQPYLVSEYVPGPSLRDFVRQDGPLVGAELERLAIGLATALAAIGQAGLVHRDFKPGNVIIGADGPRVVDFGVAHRIDTVTPVDGVIGTPGYMAPEQLNGAGSIGTSCDMWAWAATVVYAASGRPPYEADTLQALRDLMNSASPFVPDLDDPLRSVIAECLTFDPDRRPTALQTLIRLIGGANRESAENVLREGTRIATTLIGTDSSIVARCAALAEESLESGKLALAIDHATRGIVSIRPGEPPQRVHARCYYVRGVACMRGSTRGGLDDLQRAHEIDAADPDFASAYAHAWLKAGASVSQAYEVAPHDDGLRILLAQVMISGLSVGDEDAVTRGREVFAMAPQDPKVRAGFVQILLGAGPREACHALELECSEAVIKRCAWLLLDPEHGDEMLGRLRGCRQIAADNVRQMIFAEIVDQLVRTAYESRTKAKVGARRVLSLNPDNVTRQIVMLIRNGRQQLDWLNPGMFLGTAVGSILIAVVSFTLFPNSRLHFVLIWSFVIGMIVGGLPGMIFSAILGEIIQNRARKRIAVFLETHGRPPPKWRNI